MLTKTQLEEIREYLKKAENPLFFFDGDPDGLCSYLILKKYIQKGKGVVLKSKHTLDLDLYHKIEEYHPDYVFILDIPVVDQEFIDKINVPVIWIDHHPPIKRKGVHYYNPLLTKPKDNKPVTYWASRITKNKFLWLATLGTVSDWHYPKFAKTFSKKYPDLLPKTMKKPDEIIFDSKLGELILLFIFILKNTTSKVHKIANILTKIEDPYELLNAETPRAKFIQRETSKVKKEYDTVVKKVLAQKPKKNKLFLVELPLGKNAYTSTISNLMIYKYPEKVIIIKRQTEERVIMSIRSTKTIIPPILENALQGLDGFGGGHDHACGAGVAKEQFPEFLERFQAQVK
ncbi:hypothetical protein K8R33_02260 [archaeon]|nr:hypothetical protein [archaeon]